MTVVSPPVARAPFRLLRRHEVWRWFTSMRTAIHLLLLVALAAAAGSFIPQRLGAGGAAQEYQDFLDHHHVLGPLMQRIGLFDVFSTWWFALLVLLLLASLGACLVGRWHDWSRAALAQARGRGGAARRLFGNLGGHLFHSGIFLVVVGATLGSWTGMDGQVNVVEGQSWVDTHAAYDQVNEGPLFLGHLGFALHVDSFAVKYDPSGIPASFDTRVSVVDGGRTVQTADIMPNQKLTYRGVKFYQARYGWAPTVRVTAPDGTTVADAPVLAFGDPSESTGIFKIPSAGPAGQLGGEVVVVPDPVLNGTAVDPRGPLPTTPVAQVRLYQGDLGLVGAQNVYVLDRTHLHPVWQGFVPLGSTVDAALGYRIGFTHLTYYTGLHVSRDDGVPVVYTAFGIMLAGLVLRLLLGERNPVNEEA
ncbi:MAG: cytochrome c biogenesis protein ResB [Candidatus Dormibacteria bacterium]